MRVSAEFRVEKKWERMHSVHKAQTYGAKHPNWECLCLSQRDFVPFHRFLIHYSCCSCSFFALVPIWMCVYSVVVGVVVFCLLTRSFAQHRLLFKFSIYYRLNGFCFYSLFETWGQTIFLTPANPTWFCCVGTLLCFYFVKCKIGCQKLASLGVQLY